jgi:hypothetical protein
MKAKLVAIKVICDLSKASISIVLTGGNYVSDLFKVLFELGDSIREVGELYTTRSAYIWRVRPFCSASLLSKALR